MQHLASQTAAPDTPSLHLRLRTASESAHRRIESMVQLPRTLDEHRQTLAKFYGFIAPWETLIAPFISSASEQLGDRGKTPLLRTDLETLGMTAADIDRLEICRDFPQIHTFPAALGSMYVLEGSTLGGQVLSKHVETQLGLRNGLGYSYYRSYGPQVKKKWQEFRELLNATRPNDAAVVETAALDTFARLTEWFSK